MDWSKWYCAFFVFYQEYLLLMIVLDVFFQSISVRWYCFFQIFPYYTIIWITFFRWIWAIPLLWWVGGFNLHWCRQAGYRFSIWLVSIFVQIGCHIKEIPYFQICFNGDFGSTIFNDFNDSLFQSFNFWTR